MKREKRGCEVGEKRSETFTDSPPWYLCLFSFLCVNTLKLTFQVVPSLKRDVTYLVKLHQTTWGRGCGGGGEASKGRCIKGDFSEGPRTEDMLSMEWKIGCLNQQQSELFLCGSTSEVQWNWATVGGTVHYQNFVIPSTSTTKSQSVSCDATYNTLSWVRPGAQMSRRVPSSSMHTVKSTGQGPQRATSQLDWVGPYSCVSDVA